MPRVLFLALLLSSGPAGVDEREARGEPVPEAPAEPPRDPLPGDISGEGKPPPGSPEDQALWSEAHALSQRITVERMLASRLQWEARDDRYDERLGERAKSGGAEAARLLELQQVYRAALARNYLTLTRRWPVDPTRGCQYPMLQLSSAMRSGRGDTLQGSRASVGGCLEKARPAVEAMATSNAEVQRLAAEAARLLPAATAPSAGGPPAARKD